MKRFTGIAALIVLLVVVGNSAIAQSFKFGHINSEELIRAMPDFDTASAKLEAYQKELLNYLELMSVELNNKNESFTKEEKILTDLVRQTKQQELYDLQRKIQEFQTTAQENLQQKQVELFQPVYAKVDKAIKDVGKENGFLYVFDLSKGALLYFDETKSTNVLALAKAKLGLK